MLGQLSRIFAEAVQAFYGGVRKDKTGAVTVVQRTSSDLRLNPHLHVVFLDGAYREEQGKLAWRELAHLQTREVGEVLATALRRMSRFLRRRGLLGRIEDDNDADEGSDDATDARLAASAVSGRVPPAGPQWGLPPLEPSALAFDKPLCASLDGFTLHAATRAGAHDATGREALLRYVLRPPVAQERITHKPGGLVRITLKRAYQDGTVAVEVDPLSLLCRLATSVPPPRFHTVKYAGVLAPASPWRKAVAPATKDPAIPESATAANDDDRPRRRYSPWAELLKRTFAIEVLQCPTCAGRMKLLAVVTEPKSAARFLRALGEPDDVPGRSPSRGPPYCKSTVLRRRALGHAA